MQSTLTTEIKHSIQATGQIDGLHAGTAARRPFDDETDEPAMWEACEAAFKRESDIAEFLTTASTRDINRAKGIYANWYCIQWDSVPQWEAETGLSLQ